MVADSGTEGAERQRLQEADDFRAAWRRWGPYLSERQWGTVREDYSPGGDAWSYFTHDQARSRAYRWGEDGIAGLSDDKQRLCFALALWNGRDPILKERMFGLTNAEGNHGEDVKEYYFYLDNTPTHSYMKYLYKYPQGEFPYADLVDTNKARGRGDFEYELLDTGTFDEDRYFDVFVEYAKAGPEDLLIEITAHNRGPDDATLHLLPTLWFRHTWSWAGGTAVPSLTKTPDAIRADHDELGPRWLYCDTDAPALFTENETNNEHIFGSPNSTPYVKDGIDRCVVRGETTAVNPAQRGTKAALHHTLTVPAGQSATLRLRLSDTELADPWAEFPATMDVRRTEADAFYEDVVPDGMGEDERRLVRQALAGMLWSKQYYYLDVERWLAEHGLDPLAADPNDRLDRTGGRHRDPVPRHQRRRLAPRRPRVPTPDGPTVRGRGCGGAPVMTVIYEINTLVWLGELSERYGRPVTLGDVPAEVWDEVARPGVDTVWLMGVWQRSPAGLAIALRDESLLASFRQALPDLTEADIAGSAYCVRNYVVDASLGGPDGLAEARAQLATRGLRLILDYVPNHVAPDHPWLTDHPDRPIRGTQEDLARSPEAFVEVGGHIYANGRDPYFAPWQDVIQLDAFSADLRTAAVDTLLSIGDQADGVRCDMAMLLMNDVFAKTWGDRAGPAPAEDFWPYVIPRVRAHHPDLLFVAEAYWDLEWALQQQGFDHCYDKRLYDRLLHEDADSTHTHLQADLTYQRGLVRFLENHDEPRAAATLPGARELAAAVTVATLPGATLWHEGQFEGRKVRPPVFLSRRPQEPVDEQLRGFYGQLLPATAEVRTGDWRLLATTGWPGNDTHHNLLAWSWTGPDTRHLVIVNYSDSPAQGQVPLPWCDLSGHPSRLTDLLTHQTYDRDGDQLLTPGLFVDLPAWHSHVLRLT